MRPARDLTPLFRPRGIAVVGASPRGNRGHTVLQNLRRFGFEGQVHAVNPRYEEVAGYPCVAKVADLPGDTDLLVAAVGADRAVDVVDDAGSAGIRAAVVIASGFGDGGQGEHLGRTLDEVLARRGMLAVGPNCYGVLDVRGGVAAYSGSVVDPLEVGGVALILQSGALSHAITDSAVDRGLGLSALVTTGNELSVTLADYLWWFTDDPGTRVLGVFLEGLRDPSAFAAAARAARAAGKHLVVLATGRSSRGRSAALAHTGAVAGSGSALSGLLRSVGAIQVRDLDEFRETLLLVSTASVPPAPGVAVISISGGGTGLMADLAEDVGLDLPDLADDVRQDVQAALPEFGVAANPLDATGAAAEDPTLLPTLMRRLQADPSVGAICFAFNVGQGSRGQDGLYREQARQVAQFATESAVPTAALSMTSGPVDPQIRQTLADAGVPLLSGMGPGLTALAGWLDWNNRDLPDEPRAVPAQPVPGNSRVVGANDAFAALTAAGISTPTYEVVQHPRDAAAAARRVGFPCVLKIESPDLPHKTEAGGVVVGLGSAEDVDAAAHAMWQRVRAGTPQARLTGLLVQKMVAGPSLECLVGVVRDPQVGLTLSVAPGGVLVELMGEAASLPVPLTAAQADALLDAGPLRHLLSGYRGEQPFDRPALVRTIVRLSELTAAYGDGLAAAEINPLLVGPLGTGVHAVDCLIVKEEE